MTPMEGWLCTGCLVGGRGRTYRRNWIQLYPPCCVTLAESFNLSLSLQEDREVAVHLSGLPQGLETKQRHEEAG